MFLRRQTEKPKPITTEHLRKGPCTACAAVERRTCRRRPVPAAVERRTTAIDRKSIAKAETLSARAPELGAERQWQCHLHVGVSALLFWLFVVVVVLVSGRHASAYCVRSTTKEREQRRHHHVVLEARLLVHFVDCSLAVKAQLRSHACHLRIEHGDCCRSRLKASWRINAWIATSRSLTVFVVLLIHGPSPTRGKLLVAAAEQDAQSIRAAAMM